VICDPDKLDDKGCNGAPDLIMEILSPSNAGSDLWIKFNQYLITGVKEYMIVDPIKNEVTIYILDNGKYIGTWYSKNNILPVTVLPGCEIDLNAIFAQLNKFGPHNTLSPVNP
jgi:Uma2 family endonuclease